MTTTSRSGWVVIVSDAEGECGRVWFAAAPAAHEFAAFERAGGNEAVVHYRD